MPSQPSSTALTHLPAATFLAATGGSLDAVVYLNHGQVFANAMTGNVVFLGIALTERNWIQALRHIAPITAFLIGVLAARRLALMHRRYGGLFVLLLEIAALLLVGFLPLSFPELLYTAIISFVSAFQVTTFRRVGRFTYNSTFVTGNLREVAEGLFDSLFSPDPTQRHLGRRKSFKLASICLAFFVGACIGAFAAYRFPRHALWAAEPFLLIALVLVLIHQSPDQASPGKLSAQSRPAVS